MWSRIGLLVSYALFSLFKDVEAKICAQYRGYNDIIVYVNCYGNCCGDWSYRYCCPSSTMNVYAICAGITLLGIVVILIAAVCCHYVRRRRGRSERDRTNRTEIPTVAQSVINTDPPAYSSHDPLRGYTNPAFPAEVSANFDYMKPPDYQRDPPDYEKDPPSYQSAVINNSNNVDVADNGHGSVDIAPQDMGVHNAVACGSVQNIDISQNSEISNADNGNERGNLDNDERHHR